MRRVARIQERNAVIGPVTVVPSSKNVANLVDNRGTCFSPNAEVLDCDIHCIREVVCNKVQWRAFYTISNGA